MVARQAQDGSREGEGSGMRVVRFSVGDRQFALDVMAVDEVVQPRPATSVPGQPDFIEGLIELRGQYLPLIDLRRRFGSDAVEASAKLVIVTSLGRQLALVVDRIGQVDWIPSESLRSSPVENELGGETSVSAVAQLDGRMVVILGCDGLLSAQEMAALPAR